MTSWFLEVIDFSWAIAAVIAVFLFPIALLVRYENEKYTPNSTDLLKKLQNKDMQDNIGIIVNKDGESVLMTNIPVQIKEAYLKLDETLQLMHHKYDKLNNAYRCMQWAAFTALFALLIVRLTHFNP